MQLTSCGMLAVQAVCWKTSDCLPTQTPFHTARALQHQQELLTDPQAKQLSTPERLAQEVPHTYCFPGSTNRSTRSNLPAVPVNIFLTVAVLKQMSCIRESLLFAVPQSHDGLCKEMFSNKAICHYLRGSDNALWIFMSYSRKLEVSG